MIVRVALSAERLRELVNYDPDSGIMTSRVRRHRLAPGDPIGTLNRHGRLVAGIDYTIHHVHRLAFLYMTGRWPELLIDHINGDSTDNRWRNLREADYSQNVFNQRAHRRNTSGHKNVYWVKSDKVWRVLIKAHGKYHNVGRFHDKADAIKARNFALIQLHGEFARLD